MAKHVVIRSPQPADIPVEEVEELARIIRRLDIDIETQVIAQRRKGVGVTYGEVITVTLLFLGWGGTKLADKIADVTIGWALKRYEGKRKGSKRPTFVNIYGPDGAVVKSVKLKGAKDEIEDLTEEQSRRKHRP